MDNEVVGDLKSGRVRNVDTRYRTRFLLQMLADRGEAETFRFIRRHVLRGEAFAGEEEPAHN